MLEQQRVGGRAFAIGILAAVLFVVSADKVSQLKSWWSWQLSVMHNWYSGS